MPNPSPVHLTHSFAAAPNAQSKPKPANHVRAKEFHNEHSIKSQKKRNITNEKSRQRNRAIKSELKTAIRAAREAVAAGDATAAYAKGLYACRLPPDKAVSKGVIHKTQAANRKSGVMALVNTIVTDEVRAAYVKPEAKKQEATGSKKAARKAEKAAGLQGCQPRRRPSALPSMQKLEAAAAERKAKEAAEAAAAEAAAEAEAAEGEEAAE